MIVAFRSLFSSQYEGGANWLEVTLRCLGTLPQPPECLVVDATSESLPESLRTAAHVQAVPLEHVAESRSTRLVKKVARRVQNRSWENPGITKLAEEKKVDLWVAFAWFAELGTQRPLLICYPDFQYRYFPQLFDAAAIRSREEQWDFVAENAKGIFTISETTGNDALKLHPQIENKLYVCGFPPMFEMSDLELEPEAIRRKYSLPERFFVVSNQFWEHKNHLLVLRALDRLKREGNEPPVIAFTGRPYDQRRPEAFSELLRFIHEHDLHDACRFFGVLPRSEQLALIRAAEAVIQPSRFEGRGAITEEACLLGTQLLCSDLPTHRELDLPNTIFFDPDDEEFLAELLRRSYPHSMRDAEGIAADSARLAKAYGENLIKIFERVIAR